MRMIGFLRFPVVVTVVVFSLFFVAEVRSGDKKLEELNARLKVVRRQMVEMREELVKKNAAFSSLQHKMAYSSTNTVVKRLYGEIRVMERQLVEKRKQLNNEIQASPEWREVQKRRKEAYDRMAKMKKREQLVLNEIKAAKAAGE